MIRFVWPLALFLLLAGFLFAGLGLNPREVPSPLIGRPAPPFSAPLLSAPDKRMSRDDLKGKVWVLNVWASWCVACRDEHPVLLALAKKNVVPVFGLNYKDKPASAMEFLRMLGNPYAETLLDLDGRIGIDFGVYGVPETYVIDRAGVIRFKHVGPLTPDLLTRKIEPLLRELNS